MSVCSNYFHCNPEKQEEYARDGDLVYHKCLNCGLIWRLPSSFGITKKYDASYFKSKNYSKNRNHKTEKSTWLINIARKFNPQISNLLEVGCSIGNTLEAARNLGINHLGIDISPFAVDFCRKYQLNAETASLEELIQREQNFDLIFMQHVLEHFPDPFETLKQCHELLGKEGLILILVPNSLFRRAEKGRGNHRFYSIRGVGSEHFVYFNYETLSKVLDFTGFEVVQKNYPVSVNGHDSVVFYANRQYRRNLSHFNGDQEILIIARRKETV